MVTLFIFSINVDPKVQILSDVPFVFFKVILMLHPFSIKIPVHQTYSEVSPEISEVDCGIEVFLLTLCLAVLVYSFGVYVVLENKKKNKSENIVFQNFSRLINSRLKYVASGSTKYPLNKGLRISVHVGARELKNRFIYMAQKGTVFSS